MAVAILDMQKFGCGSCVYTIEKMGRKVKGVDTIHVDLAKYEIHLEYNGEREVLLAIRDIVRRIGHDAVVRDDATDLGQADPQQSPCSHL